VRNPVDGLARQAQGEEVPLRAEPRAPRTYELMVILHPDLTEEDLPVEIDRISGYVSASAGVIEETLRESPWGRRRLAYPIRHGGRDLRDGFYVVYHLDIAPDKVTEVEREMKLNEQIIRYMVTSYVAQPIDPRVLEQQEIDAEDAAAAAYAADQAAERDAEEAAAAAYAAEVAGTSGTEPEADAQVEASAEEGVAEAEPVAVVEETVAEAEPEAVVEEPVAEAEPEAVVQETVAESEAEPVTEEAAAEAKAEE